MGRKHTEEWKKKHSQDISGDKNWLYGKHLSEETKRKLSEARQGRYCGENNPFYGRKHSETTRRKLSEMAKRRTGKDSPRFGKHLSEEARRKISEKAKKRLANPENNPMYGKRGKDNPHYGMKYQKRK